MRAVIRVQLDRTDRERRHRFLNFGEDVYRAVRDVCAVDIDEIDAATDHFHVREIPKRSLGFVTQTLDRLIRKANFEGEIHWTRLDL